MAWLYFLIIVLLGGLCVFLYLLIEKNKKKTALYAKELHSFETIVNFTHDALFVIEIVNGKLLHVNQSAAELLGYKVEDLMAKTYFDLLPKEFLQKSAEKIADVWEQKGMVFTDIPFVHTGGEIIPVESSAKIGSFEDNPAIVIYARDMRERLRLENEIKEANSALRETNKLVTEKNKEITDSINYAKRIQYTLITSEKAIQKMLERLKR